MLNCLGISLTTSLGGGDLKLLIRGSLGSLCHYGCPGPTFANNGQLVAAMNEAAAQ